MGRRYYGYTCHGLICNSMVFILGFFVFLFHGFNLLFLYPYPWVSFAYFTIIIPFPLFFYNYLTFFIYYYLCFFGYLFPSILLWVLFYVSYLLYLNLYVFIIRTSYMLSLINNTLYILYPFIYY